MHAGMGRGPERCHVFVQWIRKACWVRLASFLKARRAGTPAPGLAEQEEKSKEVSVPMTGA